MGPPLITTGPERHERMAPLPLPPPEPYEVRVRETIGDTATLIGHDGRGLPMAEFRVPRQKLSPGTVEWVAQWCRANDGADLRIVP